MAGVSLTLERRSGKSPYKPLNMPGHKPTITAQEQQSSASGAAFGE
jgi:hypothetical protein